MLKPFAVELVPHDAGWSRQAAEEAVGLRQVLGDNLLHVHHIGSTAIPHVVAKPIVDLLPVVAGLAGLDRCRDRLEAIGYRWMGSYGLPGRRYCVRDDPRTGKRLFQAHWYADGSSEITRHLAFRDYLIAHPDLAEDYSAEKLRCRNLHAHDSHAYGDCKSNWVSAMERKALDYYGKTSG